MVSPRTREFLDQISNIYDEYVKDGENYKNDLREVPIQIIYRHITRVKAAIIRIAGKNSTYYLQIDEIERTPHLQPYQRLACMLGALSALFRDLQSGYLATLNEQINAEMFADFLEMADHLFSEGYKDAAVVIAGSTLEQHLRKLCQKHNISTEVSAAQGVKPKKAETMNTELRNIAYNLAYQKQITAWLDLRNNAAHGQYDKYTAAQAQQMIRGIREFIASHSA